MTKKQSQKVGQIWFFLKVLAIVAISLGVYLSMEQETVLGVLLIVMGGFMYWGYNVIQFEELQEQIDLIKKKIK